MDDGKIIELLKKSQAFNGRFSVEMQAKMLNAFPSLEPENKLKIVKILVNEIETLEKAYAEQKKVLEEYEMSLENLVRRADKETKIAIEDIDRDAAMDEINTQLKAI